RADEFILRPLILDPLRDRSARRDRAASGQWRQLKNRLRAFLRRRLDATTLVLDQKHATAFQEFDGCLVGLALFAGEGVYPERQDAETANATLRLHDVLRGLSGRLPKGSAVLHRRRHVRRQTLFDPLL